MGSNTFTRCYYTDDELLSLVNYALDNPLTSIRNHSRVFATITQWRADVPRLLDKDSTRRFYYLLETANKSFYCKWCGVELGYRSYRYCDGVPNGFAKYCTECLANNVWKRAESLGADKLKARGRKITDAKLEFYATDEGKKVAKSIGEQNAIKMRAYVQSEDGLEVRRIAAEKSSITLKNLILNGSLTPKSNNRNTHWESWYNDKRYRSSWEAFYQSLNESAQHEVLRIPYVDCAGKDRVYIVDFVDDVNKQVIEVKPRELLDTPKMVPKKLALENWALTNGYSVIYADQQFLFSHPLPSDMSCFDLHTQQKLLKYYGKVKD